MALEKEQIDALKKDAADNWNNDLDLAIAAQIHGAGVVMKSGSQILDWMDKKQIQTIKGLMTKADNADNAPAKTDKAKKNGK